MGVYSFLDIQASLEGPGGSFQLGSGSGNAEEGITIDPTGDTNVMTIGADGTAMHSLKADKSGTVTITLLRTSTTNALLQNLFNFQTASSRTHGQNTISIRNPVSGDAVTCTQCAFAKAISNPYAVEGGKLAWTFHAGKIDTRLGM